MIVDFAQRWHEIEPLLDRLFDVPAAERTDWLRGQCEAATLRALVTQALDNAPDIEMLERGVAQWLPALADDLPDTLPSVSGYRVLRFVGAGGMASVFEAERELPGGSQTVALKLLRIDVHDPDERRRFLREQRILARLQHPHIAQLLDAGFTSAGTPFLALEFVSGDNLIAHCERRGLGARERLALFIDVCAAVEHAHRNLIVHRDLKPGNVLVSADGCVKLVDFGIAKLLTGEGEETRTEARRLTRTYAAPEQLAGGAATTAIDVYALGVLLAELLGGVRPLRADDRAIDAAVVDHDTVDRAGVDTRAFDDATLRRKLGPDLHAIVCQATQLDPIRRYATAAALRDDIERHLEGKPLRARADTFSYRVLTFAKRHALAVAAGAASTAILVGATTVSLHETHLAHRAAQNVRAQALVAEAEAQRADAVKSFLEGLFESASPGTKTSETAEELLARGRERADRDFAMQPALRVEILALVGDLERRSGHPDRAQQPLEAAAALAKAQFGATDRRTLHVEYLIAKEADELGRVRDATSRLQSAVEAFDSGPNRGSQEEVQALAWLAGLNERIGESAKAIDVGANALALARRVLPNDSNALTEAILNLGWIFTDAGHADRAEPLLREALARKRSQLGARHADVADVMTILSWALNRRGRYGQSEQLMRDALDIDASAYTRPHPHVTWHLNDLANVLALEGKLGEASAFYAKSIALDRALAPAAALTEAVSLGNLARIRFSQGAYAEAEVGFRDAIERKQRLLGADYGDNGRNYDRACLAEILIERGRFDEARMLVDEALAEARRRHRDAHPDIAFALTVEARLMAALGNREAAAVRAGEAVATYTALADRGSDKATRARLLFGEILQSLDRDDEAKPQFESALAAARAIEPNAAALIVRAATDLARVDDSLGDKAAAHRLRAEAEASLAGIPSEQSTERDAAIRLVADASARTKL
ncbi:serine/threonine-protein kinase [Dokdonella soli]|uniref:Protein kinase domain-containing protein n=1 Tax=Dokdonella soli TaxID=529810 RepID=A0ABP3TQF4_9GAMM